MSRFQTLTPSRLSRADFVEAFADIYEHSPWVAERAFDLGTDAGAPDAGSPYAGSPYATIDQIDALHQRMADILLNASFDAQLALINAHPDLAGKAAVRGELTAASTSEQADAGIHACSAEEFARFTELNKAYRAKFGFPFIMAVKGSNRQQILAAFAERIHNSPEQEFACALAEINKIALLRLQQL